MYFSFANAFSPGKFPQIRQMLSSVGHAKSCNCFSKIYKVQIEFFTNIRMTRNSEKKNKQILKNNAARNDPGNNTKKILNLILENSMPKAIISSSRVSLLRFPAVVIQSYFHSHALYSHYCVCLHNFSRANQNVLVSYMSHKFRTKIIAQLNFLQRLQIANQKGYSNFDTWRAHHDFYHNNIWFLRACVIQMSCK